eukprot:jgi/Botrbrau1/3711/Bobra.0008s0036.1
MLDLDRPTASQQYASMLGNDGVELKTEALEDLLYDQDQYVKVRKWQTVGTCTSACSNAQGERARVIPCCHAPQTDLMPLKKALRQMKDVREPQIWQTGNIPVDVLEKEVGHIFRNGVLVQPHLLNNEVVKAQVTQGTVQDIVARSKGSSTLFHIDAPMPMPSTIFVIDGIKEGIDIPTYSSTGGCISRDHWEAFKNAVLRVQGVWFVVLGKGQHAHIPPLHVHAVVNNTFCLSLNSTGDEAASPTYLPKALSSYATMMRLSETDEMREFFQGTINIGPGLNAIYEAAVQNMFATDLEESSYEERGVMGMWAGGMIEALYSIMHARAQMQVPFIMPGFSNDHIYKKARALKVAMGWTSKDKPRNDNTGRKRPRKNAGD